MTPTPPPGPPLLGPLLTQLRLARGWSQQRSAAELCAAAGVPTLSRHEISRWERQVRVPGDFWLRWLAVVLAAPAELLAGAAARTRVPAPTPVRPAGGTRSRAALLALAQRWLADPRAGLLVAAPGRCAPPAPPTAGPDPDPRARPSPGSGSPLSGGTPPASRRPGPVDAVDLAELRRLDDLAGGVDLAPLGADRLRRLVRALPRSGPAGRRRLLPVLAESAQIAGWLAADAGDLSGGLDAYRLGLRAAASAGDPALAGHVLGSASHMLAGVGDAPGALLLARTAYAGSRRWAGPGLRALLLHRVALAAALGGQPGAAAEALGAAERAAEKIDPDHEPPWLYWLDGPELAAMAGRALVALGRPRRAEALLGAAREPGRPRRAAVYGGWLARGYLQLGEVELACDVAGGALLDAVRAGSPRAVTQLAEVRRRLADHRRAPAVRRHAALVAAARPYLPRPLPAPGAGRSPPVRVAQADTGGYRRHDPTG
ncbi:transcriptional regulator [Micromonospora sp. WMMD812]|uniref:transcriptional regulator n=1 Tax=Micromonospora sp. WMMD812 TaxID=3015152 RepID=UPI00248B2827|nr:transcriptional regulator [Micromonospora sp. WMMD812]WBB67238.1 transcriptional regulator [Micromonospora sp. WMMD812]